MRDMAEVGTLPCSVMGTSRLFRAGAVASIALLPACGAASQDPGAPTAAANAPVASSAPSSAPASASASPAVVTAPPVAAPAAGAWPFDAAPPDAERAAQLDRLKKDAGPLKSNWTPPGKTDRYGHAEALIGAPPDAVRSKLTDYAHYKELAGPKFKSVKVVDKQGASTDVYFQLPIMKGMITIWYVTRFAPPKAAAGGDVIEGTFVKGNIKGMQIAFNIKPGVDEKSSTVVCDLVLQPNVPAPQAAIDEELRDACGDAMVSLRDRLGVH